MINLFYKNIIFKLSHHIIRLLRRAINAYTISVNENIGEYRIRIYKSGQLINIIGKDNANKVKKLTIKGPINKHDILFFRKMTNLENINLSEAYIKRNRRFLINKKIGAHFFNNNKKLRKIHMPQNTTYIPDYAFANCSNLEIVIFPDSLKYIGEKSFYNTKIRKVIIPKSVKYINYHAFYKCTYLEELIFEDGKKDIKWEVDSFKDAPIKKLYLGRNSKFYDYNELYDVSNLKDIILGKYIKKVYTHFGTNIETITCYCSRPPQLRNHFNGTCTLFVPESSYLNYWLHPKWGSMNIHKIKQTTVSI